MYCLKCSSWTPGKAFYCPHCGSRTKATDSGSSFLLACSAAALALAIAASLLGALWMPDLKAHLRVLPPCELVVQVGWLLNGAVGLIALKGAGDIEYDWCDGCERLFFDRGELSAFDAFADS